MCKDKWIELSKSALSANIAVARALLSPRTALGAVVKANAYGHGVAELALSLEADAGIAALCVVDIAEAERLRSLGVRKTIVLIGHLSPDAAESAVEVDVVPFVFSKETIKALDEAASARGKLTRVILKVDTGMGRLGVRFDETAPIVAFMRESRNLELAGFATHFAQSDSEDGSYTAVQKRRFKDVIDSHIGELTPPFLNTASNSGGILAHPDAGYDLARFGIGLYGLHPSHRTECSSDVDLKPVLEYKARIIHIQQLRKGESVSYGSTWTAEAAARIAVLPVGYSDGYLRAYANGGSVLINGVRCPLRGRVCMNFTMFDVSNLNGVVVGDVATLISADRSSGCFAGDLAEIAGTINYEVITILPVHLERVIVP